MKNFLKSKWQSVVIVFLLLTLTLSLVPVSADVIKIQAQPALDDLIDVNATSPDNQDVLTWDGASGRWIPALLSGGGGNVTNPLTTDLNFAGYKAIAMACDSGDTLPESPSDGQWFLHTKTNRKIIYQYSSSNSQWMPRAGFGSEIKIYIDGTNGTDDMEHGDDIGTDALLTSGYALTRMIDSLTQFSGDIHLYFGDGIYEVLGITNYVLPKNIYITANATFQYAFFLNNRSWIIFLSGITTLGDETLETDNYSLVIVDCSYVDLAPQVETIKRHDGTHAIVLVDSSYVLLESIVDGIDKTANGVDITNNGILATDGGTIQNCDTGIITRSGGVLTENSPTYTNNNVDKDLDPHEEYAKDDEVADAISKAHDQNTDTDLGTLPTKNPPVDDDLVVQRDSTDAWTLFTSTWAEIKAFLKSYFNTLYAAINHASTHGVGGNDTVFPADPDSDKYLIWDDDPGQLIWQDAVSGGDMQKATYDTDTDDIVDKAESVDDGTYNATAEEIEGAVDVSHIQGTDTTVGHKVVTSDGYCNGFGNIVVLANNDLITVYRKGTTHSSDKGKIVMKKSTNLGGTWSAESTVYEDATYDSRDPCISLLSNETLIVSFFKYDHVGAAGLVDGVHVIKSTDSGANWGTPIQLNSAFTKECDCSSPVIELANGHLLLGLYGSDIGDTYDSATCMKSTDGGDTWGSEVTIGDGQADSRYYGEPNLVLLNTADVLAVIRCPTNDHQYISNSVDSGATWSAPVSKFIGSGSPRTIKLSDGRLACIYRAKTSGTSNDPVIRLSDDDGATWSEDKLEIFVDTSGLWMNYGSIVEIVDGITACIYFLENSDTDYEVRFKYITSLLAAQPLLMMPSKLVWKDASSAAMADDNRTTTLDWTDLDLTAYTSQYAKFALIVASIHIDSWTSGRVTIRLRKNGTAPNQPVVVEASNPLAGQWYLLTIYCALDSEQILEYRLEIVGTAQADFQIQVLGYIE